jgi:hypothetical protein
LDPRDDSGIPDRCVVVAELNGRADGNRRLGGAYEAATGKNHEDSNRR